MLLPDLTYNDIPWYLAFERNTASPVYRASGAVWEGIGEGWYWSEQGGGMDDATLVASPAGVPVTTNNSEVNHGFNAPAVPSVFNGDFEDGTAHLGARFPITDAIPGWSFHGGRIDGSLPLAGGTHQLKDANGGHALALSLTASEAVHNRMYIASNANNIGFQARIYNPSDNDQLNIYLTPGDSGTPLLVASMPLDDSDNDIFKPYDFQIPAAIRTQVAGKTATLSFKLEAPGALNVIDSEVWIDNIYVSEVATTEEIIALPMLVGDDGAVPGGTDLLDQDLTWTAEGAGGHDIQITIAVDGPVDEFLVKKAASVDLVDQNFTLAPGSGDSRTLAADPKTYANMFTALANGFKDVNRDRLYGVHITVSKLSTDAAGVRHLLIRHYLVYRWVTATNAPEALTKTGRTAAFPNTLMDGAGHVVREKTVDLFLPDDLDTTFEGSYNQFTYGGTVTGSNSDTTWRFDPVDTTDSHTTVAGEVIHKTDTLTIKADGQQVGQLDISGRATRTATFNVDLAGFKNELKRVIRAIQQFRGPGADARPGVAGTDDDSNGTADDASEYGWAGSDDGSFYVYDYDGGGVMGPDGAPGDAGVNDDGAGVADDEGELGYGDDRTFFLSAAYAAAFSGFLPGQAYTNAQLNTFVDGQATALRTAIEADYQPVNNPDPGISLVNTGGNVTMAWRDVFWDNATGPVFAYAPGTSIVYGAADFDRWTVFLRTHIATGADLSEASKQWALAEGLNRMERNDGNFGISINLTWDGTATLAGFIANTVSHEVGHTFGLNEAYRNNPGGGATSVDPNDIMRAGANNDPNLSFDARNIALLQASLGLQPNGDLPITAALAMYQRDFNLPGSTVGIRDHSDWRALLDQIQTRAGESGTAGDFSDLVSVGITNGRFDVSDPTDPDFGWKLGGLASVENAAAVLTEGDLYFDRLAQAFLVPENAGILQFTVAGLNLGHTAGRAADTFEVALLDPVTMTPLGGTVLGLDATDALLNVQASGATYVGAGVTVSGLSASGDVLPWDGPVTVQIDLSDITAGTVVALYFDLLGFGDVDSRVVIDNVMILGTGPVVNTVPVANAGPDQSVSVGSTVSLNGSGSSDVDGNALTYRWSLVTVPAGSVAALSDPGVVNPTFVADRAGTYVAQLIVNDGTVDSVPDTVTITTLSSPPVPTAVDSQVSVSLGLMSYDRRTLQTKMQMTITNTSPTPIYGPVWIVIKAISDPSVTLVGGSGRTAEGYLYIDVTSLLGDGRLDPSETITRWLSFSNPLRRQFNFSYSIRGLLSPWQEP